MVTVTTTSRVGVRRKVPGGRCDCLRACDDPRRGLRSALGGGPGVGDIDNAMISPNGEVAFAVETKTRTVLAEHLRRVYQQATWLCRRHRCRHGAVPVLVPAERRNLERFERGVLIVSPDRLLASLRAAYRAACPPAR